MTNIGLIIEGVSNLKVFGPILEECGKDSIQPHVFVDARGGGKNYDILTVDKTIERFDFLSLHQVLPYQPDLLIDQVVNKHIDVVLCINSYSKYGEQVLRLAKNGIKVYDLDYFVNAIYSAARKGAARRAREVLGGLEKRLVTSRLFSDLEEQILFGSNNSGKSAQKLHVVGSPVYDVVKHTGDVLAARSELGLPSNRGVVTVLAPNVREHQVSKVYGLLGKRRISSFFSALREYCDLHDYYLVVKSREKQWNFEAYQRNADMFMYDYETHLYPSTSAWLMAASDLVVHFGSMGVMEAAAARVPSLGIGIDKIDHMHGYMDRGPRQYVKRALLLDTAHESLFNYDGVATTLPLSASVREINASAETLLAARSHNEAFGKYAHKFIYNDSHDAAARVLAHISR